MLHSHYYHHHHLLLLTQHHYSPLSHSSQSLLHFLHKPTTTLHTVSAIPSATLPWLTHLAQVTNETMEGPIQFLPFFTSIIDTIDDPAILQVASTVILTAIITAFFRSRWRRVKRAQELVIHVFIKFKVSSLELRSFIVLKMRLRYVTIQYYSPVVERSSTHFIMCYNHNLYSAIYRCLMFYDIISCDSIVTKFLTLHKVNQIYCSS
ncbi:hypothetical protein Lalb_Chr03g0030791 [Lupinus albus]|uniref:Uncharacterized protein n=1 Tax=Lupinus albus TaxID=3870 RepID=A0A6A4QUT7_LUPAL|nr:hypothetical protein Lalb_Chr03g0030791 [Lupinus albus]